MSLRVRVERRVRGARRQPSGLRLPYLRAIADRRAPALFALRCLRRLSGAGLGELRGYLAEVAPDAPLPRELAAAEAEHRRASPGFAPGSIGLAEGAVLYALARALRPGLVVETGTASGFSSAFLLAALDRNGEGRLVSIDLPFADAGGELAPVVAGTEIALVDASPLPPGKEPGWVVPERLHRRWELRLGDARELLRAALAEAGPVRLFLHDSLHTREHMLFEFETVWPHLEPGGVIAADDVFLREHDALPAFAHSVGTSFTTFSGLGFVRKS